MATITTSSFLNLNWRDFLKGAAVAALTAPFSIIISSMQAGNLHLDWPLLGATALSGFLAYINKNFLTGSSIKITDVDKETMKAVKEGDAMATVVSAPNAPE